MMTLNEPIRTSNDDLDDFSTSDDNDLQRRGKLLRASFSVAITNKMMLIELRRLLGTAKDKSRKNLLEKALSSLDTDKDGKRGSPSSSASNTPSSSSSKARSPSAGHRSPPTSKRPNFHHHDGVISAIHPSTQARLQNQRMPTEGRGKSSDPRMRPMSAQRSRRGSFVPTNLEIIPENKWLNNLNNEVTDLEHEVDLSVDDISDFQASCYDPQRLPQQSIRFMQTRPTSTTNSHHMRQIARTWFATGLAPHFLSICLKERWLLKMVSISSLNMILFTKRLPIVWCSWWSAV
jgi:hypothetical protein